MNLVSWGANEEIVAAADPGVQDVGIKGPRTRSAMSVFAIISP